VSAGTRPISAGTGKAGLSSGLLLRALAICAIVLNHASGRDLGGGIDVLLLLVGLNLGHFQSERLSSQQRWSLLREAAAKLLLPYYAILAGYFLWHGPGGVGLHDLLLVSNFNPDHERFLLPYWFVAAYLQLLLALVLLSAIPPVAKLIKHRPDLFGFGLLAAAVVIKIVALQVFGHQHLLGRTLDQFLYIVALGWCVQFARTRRRRFTLAAVAIALAVIGHFAPETFWSGFDGNWHYAALLAAVLVLLFVPTIMLPGPLRSIVTTLSVASFTIYLVHPLLFALWKAEPAWQLPAAVAAIVIGVLVCRTIDVVCRTCRAERSRLAAAAGQRNPAASAA